MESYNYMNQMYPYQAMGHVSRAYAEIKGSDLAPNLTGYVRFTDVPYGTEVMVEVSGLPHYQPAMGGKSRIGPHGFHIHEDGNCHVDNREDPFQHTGGHWNPTNKPHGNHAGDFPVLFSNNGYARMSFFSNRLYVQDVIG